MSSIITIMIDTNDVEIVNAIRGSVQGIADFNNLSCDIMGTFIADGEDDKARLKQIKDIYMYNRQLESKYILNE